MLKRIFLPRISPIIYLIAFLTHSQVEIIFFRKGFWHKAWIWLISWASFTLRKSIGRIQPLTFGFQSTMKSKRHFFTGQSDQHCTITLWVPEGDGFTSLIFTAFCLLQCAIRNDCVWCVCKLGRGVCARYPCQCFRDNGQVADFWFFPFRDVPQN